MRPDPRKVEAIINMPRPSDRQGLLRALGMIKYLAQYIPNESSITAPLRLLLKQDVEWSWQPEHDVTMQLVRETLARDTVLTFYDVRKPATIQADASQSGLGCGLMQQGRPVWQCQDPARGRGNVTSRQSTYIRDADAGSLRHTVVRYRHTRMQSVHRVGSSAQSVSGHCCRE